MRGTSNKRSIAYKRDLIPTLGPGRRQYPTAGAPSGVNAGTPGAFTGQAATSDLPNDIRELRQLGALGQTTAWPTGDWVDLGNGKHAYWDGNSWETGKAKYPVTTITAGGPGVISPTNHDPIANLAALNALGITKTPGVPWLAGQYIVLDDASEAHWDGAVWAVGRAPAVVIPITGVTPGLPGNFLPLTAAIPANLVDLNALGALGQTAKWGNGNWVQLGDNSEAYWDGSQFAVGRAPIAPTGVVLAAASLGNPATVSATLQPAGATVPRTINDLAAFGSLGQTAHWRDGQFLTLGNGSETHWDGTQWVPLRAPITTAISHVGAPGIFSPYIPVNLADLQAHGDLGQTTAWTVGQYIELADNSEVHWDGVAWKNGRATAVPAVPPTGVTAGAPGAFTPANAETPADLATLQGLGALGQTALWNTGDYVVLDDGTDAYFDGTDWQQGRAPAVGGVQGVIPPASPTGTIWTVDPNSSFPKNLSDLRAQNPDPQGNVPFPQAGHVIRLPDNNFVWYDGHQWVKSGDAQAIPSPVTAGVQPFDGDVWAQSAPAGLQVPADLDALIQLGYYTDIQRLAWPRGTYFELGDGMRVYYEGLTIISDTVATALGFPPAHRGSGWWPFFGDGDRTGEYRSQIGNVGYFAQPSTAPTDTTAWATGEYLYSEQADATQTDPTYPAMKLWHWNGAQWVTGVAP